ncbi:MAG: branched-chain amino acid transferase, partial [Mesorhizobium sp.]
YGAETALIVDINDNIAEGPGFNVFTVKDAHLKTPAYSVLAGITRQTVFDLCGQLGLSVSAGDIDRDELKGADEVFITSTAGGIMPVSKIDDTVVGDGKVGALTRQLTDLYWEKHTDPAWSTAVNYA